MGNRKGWLNWRQIIIAISLSFSTLTLSLLVFGRTAAQEEPPGDFTALMASAQSQGSVRVIVGLDIGAPFVPEGNFSAPSNINVQRAAIGRAQEALLTHLAGHQVLVYGRYEAIPYVALELDAAALRRLSSSPVVAHIQEDIPVPPALASSTVVIGAPQAWSAGHDGTGQAVAILDTGIDAAHPFFGGRVVSEACFSNAGGAGGAVSLCPSGGTSQFGSGSADATIAACNGGSLCEHGTHVAGIAAGNGTSFGGVARDADIIAFQIFTRFNNPGQCNPSPSPCVLTYTSDQLSALNYLFTTLRFSHTIAAANMSLGGGQFFAACDTDSRKAAIDNLLSVGIATVISSGNSGYVDSTGAPGCISTAVTVGATEDDDDIATFSNIAPFLDLLAPGVDIDSSIPGGGFASFQGTSMSAPMVTGAWAVFKEVSPAASVAAALSAFQSTGTLVNDNRTGGIETNMPRINLDGAVNTIRPGLRVNKATVPFAFPGQTIAYTIEISNTTSVTANGVVISDVVPANTTLIPGSLSPDATYSGITPGNTITWTTGANLNPGQGLSRTFSVTIDNLTAGGTISNVAAATATGMAETRFSAPAITTVNRLAACGFYDGFEAGVLGNAWREHITNDGRIRITGQLTTITNPPIVLTPHTGAYQAALDDSIGDTIESEAGIILNLDLTGQTAVTLDFWWAESLDENHPEDGVFVRNSEQGSWQQALSFNGGTSTYTHSVIDVDAVAAANGLTLNNRFQILFRFKDNWYIEGGDGYVIDDVQIRCGSLVWDGGGATNNWSEAANWAPDTVPNGNNVIFNGTSTKNALVDNAFGGDVGHMLVDTGYTGVISQSAGLRVSGNLTLTNGTVMVSGAAPLRVSGTLSHTGGIMQQTRGVNNGLVEFLRIEDGSGGVKYRGVDIDTTSTANNLGIVTVAVKAIDATSSFCTTTGALSPPYARRCYTITPQNNLAASVRLWALDGERNGIAPGNLGLYRFVPGPGWQLLTSTNGNDGSSYVYGQATTPGFSSFLLGDSTAGSTPTAVSLDAVRGGGSPEMPLGVWVSLTALLALFSASKLFAWRNSAERRRVR